MDIDIEQWELEQDIGIMSHHQEVNPPASQDLEAKQVPTDQGDIEILGDNPKGEMHNKSFDESQYRVAQSCRVSNLDDHTPLMQFEEWVIMSNIRKHRVALADATRAYVEATISSVHFLIVENKWMAKELQMAKQGGELVTTSARADFKKEILDEVLAIDIVMQTLYSKFGVVHKEIVHLNGW